MSIWSNGISPFEAGGAPAHPAGGGPIGEKPPALRHASAETGWKGELVLEFARADGRTVLAHRRHRGPLLVQRPFYPPEDGGACHVYLLHPPGGVVAGDRLRVRIRAGEGAHALITTPAATKMYRSHGPQASQGHRLRVEPGGILEWLPQETILFSGARADLHTRVDLIGDGGFLGWEILCVGLPGSGAPYDQGSWSQSFELWRDGSPLVLERTRLGREPRPFRAPWGLGGFTVVASLLCATSHPEAVERVRAVLDAPTSGADELVSVTQLRDALVCRYLGHHAERARRCFVRAWEVLRPIFADRRACAPRIWNT